ncbi:MAG: VTC domain-containing protein [Clostridia bacterium]|nr:VTC domain-containing protein [Clostridia bacterium]
MRHELKYIIGPAAAATLKSILPATLRYDPHYKDGRYTISSLYFDDLSFSAYNDKVNGEEDREKFRIRLYNGDDSYIVLEKKSKKNDMVNKYSFLYCADNYYRNCNLTKHCYKQKELVKHMARRIPKTL